MPVSSSSPKPAGRARRFFFSRIFPLPFAIGGAVVFYMGLQSLQLAKQSVDWPTVSGLVVSSKVDVDHRNDSKSYSAEVHYEYEFNGAKYSSKQVSYGDYGSGNSSRARKIVNRYPEGAEVTVHYKPDEPQESVLEPGINGGAFFFVVFGALFLLVGLGMVWIMPSMVNREPVFEYTGGDDD